MIRLKPLVLLPFLVISFSAVTTEPRRLITFEEEILYKERQLELLKSEIKVDIAELKYKETNP